MHVLIADDNRDAASSLAALVRTWGFEPVTVHDGSAALAALESPNAAPLAVLDWAMPGANGIDVCRELRKIADRPYTYCILVTGRGDKQQMVEGLRIGADDYLLKPIDPDELHARLLTGKRIVELQDQLLRSQRQLQDQATHDALTSLWNRSTILQILERELSRARRERTPVATVMADVDHFKAVNDTYGHLAGDQVLRQVGHRLSMMLRPYDTVGRYGGEEFLIVLAGCGPHEAPTLAERLRQRVAAEPMFDRDRAIRVTISAGVAVWDGEMAATEFLRITDNALYQAKRAGRNCVIMAETTTHAVVE
jgi:diguanylate cyclase (GGDEF)-like protein